LNTAGIFCNKEYCFEEQRKKKVCIFSIFTLNFDVKSLLSIFERNWFEKDHMRIPNYIFDDEKKDFCILIYEDKRLENNSATVNFLSLYVFLKEEQSPNHRGWEAELAEKIIKKSCDQLKAFFGQLQTTYANARNILDLNFIDYRIHSLRMFKQMKNALRVCSTDNFLIRSVFDEKNGDS